MRFPASLGSPVSTNSVDGRLLELGLHADAEAVEAGGEDVAEAGLGVELEAVVGRRTTRGRAPRPARWGRAPASTGSHRRRATGRPGSPGRAGTCGHRRRRRSRRRARRRPRHLTHQSQDQSGAELANCSGAADRRSPRRSGHRGDHPLRPPRRACSPAIVALIGLLVAGSAFLVGRAALDGTRRIGVDGRRRAVAHRRRRPAAARLFPAVLRRAVVAVSSSATSARCSTPAARRRPSSSRRPSSPARAAQPW